MTDKSRKSRGVVVLADGVEKGSVICKVADSKSNSLSLNSRNRLAGIQDRRYPIVCKNIRRNFSENMVGSQITKNPT
jgi:hypothetical protein